MYWLVQQSKKYFHDVHSNLWGVEMYEKERKPHRNCICTVMQNQIHSIDHEKEKNKTTATKADHKKSIGSLFLSFRFLPFYSLRFTSHLGLIKNNETSEESNKHYDVLIADSRFYLFAGNHLFSSWFYRLHASPKQTKVSRRETYFYRFQPNQVMARRLPAFRLGNVIVRFRMNYHLKSVFVSNRLLCVRQRRRFRIDSIAPTALNSCSFISKVLCVMLICNLLPFFQASKLSLKRIRRSTKMYTERNVFK